MFRLAIKLLLRALSGYLESYLKFLKFNLAVVYFSKNSILRKYSESPKAERSIVQTDNSSDFGRSGLSFFVRTKKAAMLDHFIYNFFNV